VQVDDHPRAGRARRGERAPAERGQQVVRVDDPRAGPPDRRGDVVRLEPAAEHPDRRAAAAERRGVARQQLRVLTELLAHEPQEVVDRALLSPGRAVAVVQEEDHGVPQT
jgi:hypothetical protein